MTHANNNSVKKELLMDWFDEKSPGISVDPNNVYFIHNPEDFYSTLINKIHNAQGRVYLSSLYLGTSQLETDLVSELGHALDRSSALRVHLLFDYLRGTRGGENSTLELVGCKNLKGLDAYFFHTPDLRGYLKQYLPERVNEIVGLQHMKFYIIDNCIILSGANLSDSYFTNRQDRYVVIEDCPKLIEFFVSVFEAVASCSVKLISDGELRILPEIHEFPFHDDVDTFCQNFRSKIESALKNLETLQSDPTKAENTMIYPFLQMGPFQIQQEEQFLDRLLKNESSDIDVCFSTGYFNFHDTYADSMLNNSRFPISILLASPQANGFYGASGISGSIPALYVYLSMLFHRRIQAIGKAITLFEYARPDWTFHAKGIWIEPTSNSSWAATVVGSSNYGYRSTFRDLEAQVLIVTSNTQLMKRISDEKKYLMEHMTKIDSSTFQRADHSVPIWVRLFARFFRNFF
ncbi:CDP-diacylglycerol--glycerol-3-phosphate 3-phosphatidyltransferase [Aphelenchoides bicaudatus]|nr:CDP-diacylglycerol--glycerol-3-phosphate 3-phosphatidyltransferase [Aphelenchoides bicaudatus]